MRPESFRLGLTQHLRQLGDVGGDAPGLVAGEELRRRASPRLEHTEAPRQSLRSSRPKRTTPQGHRQFGQFTDAWRHIGEAFSAIETSKERWHDAEVNRIAGEIALKSSEPDAVKAETYFKRALAVAHEQQARSWELRAAMSMARLWCDQGKRDEARDLLAPVYGWFTEGFDTLDLKEAKALLDELAAR
jgi:hypothetical protein